MHVNITDKDRAYNKVFDREFVRWLVLVIVSLFVAMLLVTAWLVQHALTPDHKRLTDTQADIIIAVARFPGLVKDLISSDTRLPLLLERKTIEQANWVRKFPAPEDSGYLLFSGMDRVAKTAVVSLIRIADGMVMAEWKPDWEAINNQISSKKWRKKDSSSALSAVHPLLLPNGDLIFNTWAALVHITTCSSRTALVLDQLMHHSVELDEDGSAVWVPSIAQGGLPDNPTLNDSIRDDSLAHVNFDGRVLKNLSFSRILLNNGMQGMLLGHFGYAFNDDPIHINQISVAKHDSKYWTRGDLLISARHLSTIFLYRPSTDRIIWHQTGPWLNQHSVEFIDDHRISIFNNNVVRIGRGDHYFLNPANTNRVMVYDFDTNEITEPFAALLNRVRPLSATEGRARILPDGGLFIEETNNGRHLRFTADRLLWSRVNDYDDKHIGVLSWSRYLTANEVLEPLRAINQLNCQLRGKNP